MKTISLFIITDISGKGVLAALFIVKAKTLLKSQSESMLNKKEVFERINLEFTQNNKEGLFDTCWMGVLDLPSLINYVNTDHNPPFLLRENEIEMPKGRYRLILTGFGS